MSMKKPERKVGWMNEGDDEVYLSPTCADGMIRVYLTPADTQDAFDAEQAGIVADAKDAKVKV